MNTNELCPCRSGKSLTACCGPYLSGQEPAPTAEALMRSRYAAFATRNMDYLEATLVPEERKDFNRDQTEAWAKSSEWTGLEILSVKDGSENDAEGVVDFIAHFRQDGRDLQHRELSRFVRRDSQWLYLDGDVAGATPVRVSKVGRNDPCPCGSGRKHKKCCGQS